MRAIVPISQIVRRIPEAGRIRIGKKAGNRPVAIGEFRFTSHDQEALEQIARIYGGTVRPWSDPKAAEGQHEVITDATEIKVVLPPDPLGGSPIYELWGGGGCERRCDGLNAEVWQAGPEGPEQIDVPCICSAKGEMTCKVTTRLSVILPEIRFGGVWRLDTKGWNAAQELPGMVALIQDQQAAGMPYGVLAIKPRRTVTNGKTSKFLVPVLGMAATIEELAAGAANLSSLPASSAVAEIGAGEDEPDEAPPAIPATARPSDPDDDVVDAEVIEAGPDLEALQREIDQLGVDEKADLGTWWKNEGLPSIKTGDLIGPQVDRILGAIASYRPAEGGNFNGLMHALVADAWPEEGKSDRDGLRKSAIKAVSQGRTESSKDLDAAERDALVAGLKDIKAGTRQLHLSANGWVLQTVPPHQRVAS